MVTNFVIRHPFELLEDFTNNTTPETKITTRTSKTQLKRIENELKEKLERMGLIFRASMTEHKINEETKTALEAQFKNTRRRICLSHLDKTFRERYEDEFEDIKGSTDFYALLHQIIGEEKPEELAKEARQKLSTISRRTDEEETFTRFYTRIEKLAILASKGKDVLKEHFLEESFNSNLTPDLKRYILDQGQSSKTPKEIANYLDKMKKFKRRVEISAVSLENNLLKEEVSALRLESASFSQLLAKMDAKMDALKIELAEVNKIKATTREQPRESFNQSRQTTEQQNAIHTTARFTAPSGNSFNPERPRTQLERRRDGSIITCFSCGMKGHSKKNCRGTVICHICNQRGHIKDICPSRQPKN
ncbi:Oidioi.mRNA.OKI2018_I69.chr1.g1599.t1.cds [Oikopleura dioica]|uniref:Oidioi.mRNA.OKI2018_I69.chr1.g1599.t1.cds n=1 Tax=Oikopleura dioica TaxID=34765 RepID=A0ABN7SUR0_OIKDI|nr:Oidioi.mRNA.OKI2018_I69.chr1.g1599.t1.cds [Oikopleura dioica]